MNLLVVLDDYLIYIYAVFSFPWKRPKVYIQYTNYDSINLNESECDALEIEKLQFKVNLNTC